MAEQREQTEVDDGLGTCILKVLTSDLPEVLTPVSIKEAASLDPHYQKLKPAARNQAGQEDRA